MIVLIFGATGSAGGGVLRACLGAPAVTAVRAIVRRPPGLSHPKLQIVQHTDYADYAAIPQAFAGVDACLYCLGKSSTLSRTSGSGSGRQKRTRMRVWRPARLSPACRQPVPW